MQHTEKHFYWIAADSPYGVSSIQSTILIMVSESYWDCFKSVLMKTRGKRPIFSKHTRIKRIDREEVLRFLRYYADGIADNFDEDYSIRFRNSFSMRCFSALIKKLNVEKKLDFRTYGAGLELTIKNIME